MGNAILHPIESHTDGHGPTWLHGVICDPSGSGIIGGDGCSVLEMAHFDEGGLKRIGFLGVVEEGFEFRFSS
jgi:hypothetical protein